MLFGSRFFDFVPTKKKNSYENNEKNRYKTDDPTRIVVFYLVVVVVFVFRKILFLNITIYVVLINLYASKIYRLKSSDLKRNSAADDNDRCTNFFWENNKKPMWKNEFIDNQSMFEFVFGQFFVTNLSAKTNN